MTTDLRKTGIALAPELPWGTHLCLFYETNRDLLEILTPYVKAGLEGGERCVVMTWEHTTPEQVMQTLRAATPDIDRYVRQQALEVIDNEYCLENGAFSLHKALRYWREALEDAIGRGFEGLRLVANDAWLTSENWHAFSDYEQALDGAAAGSKTIVLCAYPLAQCAATRILEVARTHGYVIAKRDGVWEVLETAPLMQTKAELRQLYRALFDASQDVIVIDDEADRIVDINPRAAQITGYTLEELRGMSPPRDLVVPEDAAQVQEMLREARNGHVKEREIQWRAKDGRIIEFHVVTVPLVIPGQRSQWTFCSLRDITKRKEVERELQALSRRLVEVQEAERRELSRELHDRIGQQLTALGINLDIVEARLVTKDNEIKSRLKDSRALLEATSDATVDLLSELRPPMLDDLGLLAALEWYARGFTERTGVEVSVVGEEHARRLDAESEIVLFRIAQEALNNVVKHAQARHVDVELMVLDGESVLSISDDGVGREKSVVGKRHSAGGFGIATMRERAVAIGARFDVLPRRGGGTSVIVRVPQHHDQDSHRGRPHARQRRSEPDPSGEQTRRRRAR
jgi:PAS domain S-box-containing protein